MKKKPKHAANRPQVKRSSAPPQALPRPEEPRDRYLPGGTRIVFEDNDIIVIDKPAGLLTADVEGGREGRDTDSVFARLKRHVREQRKRRGTRLWIVHRLDKEASGLLVFAKVEEAYTSLKEQFRVKSVHRLYAAVVEGEVAEQKREEGDKRGEKRERREEAAPRFEQATAGTITGYLAEGGDGIVRVVTDPTASRGQSREQDGEAKLAVTHWRLQQTGSGRSLLQVRLETGRKNQIRAHMKDMGRPIVGDRRYGAQTDPIGRVCLHAFELGFTHPTTGAAARYRSTTPPEFFSLVRGKRGEVIEWRSDEGAASSFQRPLPEGGADFHGSENAAKGQSDEGMERRKNHANASATSSPSHTKSSSLPPTPSLPSWDHVAPWYESLIEERRSDHHENVILPGTLRLLGAKRGDRVLDVACGEGVLCRELARGGIRAVGVDASERLIAAAKRADVGRESSALVEYHVADARKLQSLDFGNSSESGGFDGAACVMALMNMEPLAPVFAGVAAKLKAGGRFVGVILHPAFRSPGRTGWGWERGSESEQSQMANGKSQAQKHAPRHGRHASAIERMDEKQYRRVDAYLSPGSKEIVMNPGGAASGAEPITTVTYHRPIQTYVRLLAEAGFVIDAMEEWPSARTSEPGPRAGEENRARREIPMFLAIRAIRKP